MAFRRRAGRPGCPRRSYGWIRTPRCPRRTSTAPCPRSRSERAMADEDLGLLAAQLTRRTFGDEQISELLEPLLEGLLTDTFELGDQLGGGSHWRDAVFDLVGVSGVGRAFRL